MKPGQHWLRISVSPIMPGQPCVASPSLQPDSPATSLTGSAAQVPAPAGPNYLGRRHSQGEKDRSVDL